MRVFMQINGTEDRPRLCVYRSNKQMYVQVRVHTLHLGTAEQRF